MYKNFYFNGCNGKFSVFEYPLDGPATLGPKSAMNRIFNLKGYMWLKDEEEKGLDEFEEKRTIKGRFRILGPVYLNKRLPDGELREFWLGVVCPSTYKGIYTLWDFIRTKNSALTDMII